MFFTLLLFSSTLFDLLLCVDCEVDFNGIIIIQIDIQIRVVCCSLARAIICLFFFLYEVMVLKDEYLIGIKRLDSFKQLHNGF